MLQSKAQIKLSGPSKAGNKWAPIRSLGASRKKCVSANAFFSKLFKPKAEPVTQKVVRPTVIPDPSYNIPITLLGIAGLEAYENWTVAACLTAVLGLFLTIQASRVRFIFDDEGLEVVIGATNPKETKNVFVGGENKWSYDSFINWEFWFPGFPILVYFKESQTKPEGQIHFFPIIFDGKAIYDVMVERCGPSKTSGPKDE